VTVVDPTVAAQLTAALEDELPAATQLRHRLHADPRASGDEADTAAAVVKALVADAGSGIVDSSVASTGRIVRLGDSRVALRAELDGLPLTENSDVPWRATGAVMHACGHDVHLAAMVAAARAIRSCGLAVTAILQPREEGTPSGARDVVESGALETFDIEAIIGAHVQPQVPAGVMAVTPGVVNASVDEFEIVMTGRVGHAGYPHTVADPVLAMAAATVNLQQLPARRVDPVHGAVCVVTEVHGGAAPNVIPEQVFARGTLRVMRDEDRGLMAAALTSVVEHTAAAYGCTASVRVIDNEPPLHNDPTLASSTTAVLRELGYPVVDDFRSFGADDFAFYCRSVQALMIFVGVDGVGLHDPSFVPSDDTIRLVAQALLAGYQAAQQLG
jgi:amidohydrolase